MDKKNFAFLVEMFFPAIMTNREPFKGEVKAVSAHNKLGKFTVLPQHINFITLIFKEITIHTLKKEKISYQFEKGILIVKKNRVSIFLGV